MQEKPFDCMHKKNTEMMQKKKTLLLREVSEMWICVTREMCCQGVCQCI